MKSSHTTACHIPNKIGVKAPKCESSRIDASIREKPLRSVMSYPYRKMVSVENTWLPHKLHNTAVTRQLASSSHWTDGWVSLSRFGCSGKREKSPATPGIFPTRSQSLYLLIYTSSHTSLERSYNQSTSSPICSLLHELLLEHLAHYTVSGRNDR